MKDNPLIVVNLSTLSTYHQEWSLLDVAIFTKAIQQVRTSGSCELKLFSSDLEREFRSGRRYVEKSIKFLCGLGILSKRESLFKNSLNVYTLKPVEIIKNIDKIFNLAKLSKARADNKRANYQKYFEGYFSVRSKA
jgi:hypothetical protein